MRRDRGARNAGLRPIAIAAQPAPRVSADGVSASSRWVAGPGEPGCNAGEAAVDRKAGDHRGRGKQHLGRPPDPTCRARGHPPWMRRPGEVGGQDAGHDAGAEEGRPRERIHDERSQAEREGQADRGDASLASGRCDHGPRRHREGHPREGRVHGAGLASSG